MDSQSKVFSCSWLRLIINILYFLSFIISLDYYRNLAYVIIMLIIYTVNMAHNAQYVKA